MQGRVQRGMMGVWQCSMVEQGRGMEVYGGVAGYGGNSAEWWSRVEMVDSNSCRIWRRAGEPGGLGGRRVEACVCFVETPWRVV